MPAINGGIDGGDNMAIPTRTINGKDIETVTQMVFDTLNPLELKEQYTRIAQLKRIHCYLDHCGYFATSGYRATVKSGQVDLKSMFIAACKTHERDISTVALRIKEQFKMWYQPTGGSK